VRVTGSAHRFVAGADVAAEMVSFLAWINSSWGRTDTIAFAVEAQYRLVHIHPFGDGNGRITRLVSNFIMIKAGYPFVSVQQAITKIYFSAIRVMDKGGRPDMLERVWAEACLRSLSIYLAKVQSDENLSVCL